MDKPTCYSVTECPTGETHAVDKRFTASESGCGPLITVKCLIQHTCAVGASLDDAVALEAALAATGGDSLTMTKKVEVGDHFDCFDFLCWHTLPLTRSNLLALLALGYEPAAGADGACAPLMPDADGLSKARTAVEAAVESKRTEVWQAFHDHMHAASAAAPKKGWLERLRDFTASTRRG